MRRVIDLIKKNWLIIFYFVISSAIFIHFYQVSTRETFYDEMFYDQLANEIVKNGFNVVKTNFEYRTFGFPLYLAVIKYLALQVFHVKGLWTYYLANFGLFLMTNILIYKTAKGFSVRAAEIFLFLSSFNVVTLSFATLLLSENLAIFLVSLLFYLVFLPKWDAWVSFFAGLTGAFSVFVRPSSSILFIAVSGIFVWRALKTRRYLKLSLYALGVFLVFVIGLANTYVVSGKLGIFSSETTEVFKWHLHKGGQVVKYETSIDPFSPSKWMVYVLPKYGLASVEKVMVIVFRSFTMFDRVYIETYIARTEAINNFLRVGNYFVLSSAIIAFLLLKQERYKNLIKWSAVFIVTTFSIYLPVIPEPRFSAPIYPIILALTAFYLAEISKIERRRRIFLVILQVVMVVLFFLCSSLTLSFLTWEKI